MADLNALQNVALAAAVLAACVAPAKNDHTPSAVIDRALLTELEVALTAAGYDMPAIRKRVRASAARYRAQGEA